MHKSQFSGLLIDCQTDDLDAAADFWSQALGLERRPVPAGHEDSPYVVLKTRPNDPYIEVQKVDHPSRVHLDIESDIKSWVVMEAPTGQRFCVVPPERANFEEEANRWS